MQAWLFAGNSADDQLGDIWALDVAAAQWSKLSDNADQVKAWHQSHIVTTDQVVIVHKAFNDDADPQYKSPCVVHFSCLKSLMA